METNKGSLWLAVDLATGHTYGGVRGTAEDAVSGLRPLPYAIGVKRSRQLMRSQAYTTDEENEA